MVVAILKTKSFAVEDKRNSLEFIEEIEVQYIDSNLGVRTQTFTYPSIEKTSFKSPYNNISVNYLVNKISEDVRDSLKEVKVLIVKNFHTECLISDLINSKTQVVVA